ncbi:hypothetical protein BG015_001270, partial [Linnemannia schmuckeri]
MPVAMPRGDRGNQHWAPRANLDGFTTPFPLYSGYLMKLGSNDRWQSRLFTFDGSGKRRRTPPIATYDPHVSSPFVSAPCRTQPYNPNTKWFLHIASITDIRFLPSQKSYYRCFPTTDLPRALFIQTADGRSVTLKAKKNIELERWFFVLTKMWTFQQLLQRTEEEHAATAAAAVAANANAAANAAAAGTASARVFAGPDSGECSGRRESGGAGGAGGETDPYHQLVLSNNNHPQQQRNNNNLLQQQHYQNNNNYQHHSSSSPLPPPSRFTAPPCTSHLTAHQQSSHLFNNYLQRQQMYLQHQQDQGGDYQSQSLHAWHFQQQQPQSQSQHIGNNKSWRPQRQTAPPVATIVQESLMRYQIPLPRVSAFLPGGLDWPVQQQQKQQQYAEKEVADDQGVTNAVAISGGGGGAIVVTIDEEDEKAELRESEENTRNAYLRKNSLADQFSSPPLPSSNINNNATTITMSGGAGGGRGSGVVCDGEQMNTDGSLERQGDGRGGSWHQDPSCSIPTTEEAHAGLMSPLARANTASSFHSDDPDNQALVPASAAKLFLSRNNSRRPSVSADNELLLGPRLNYCCEADADEEDEEDYGNDHFEHQSRPRWFQQQQQRETYQQPRLAIDATSETDDVPLAVVRTIRKNSIGGATPLPLPMGIQTMGPSPIEVRHYVHEEEDEEDDDEEDETGAHDHLANKHHNSFISPRRRRRHRHSQYRQHQDKIHEPALLHVQRYSRWQKTQLSSEDESGTNRDSFAALTNTPDMSCNSYPTFLATNYNNNRESYLNNLNNCASHDRDPYQINGGYEANKESLSDPTLNQPHLRSSAEPNLPRPSSSPFVSSTDIASAAGLPATRQSMAAVQSKPAIPTVSILKRPSLPGLDTAALQAAVEASKAMQQREKTTCFQSFPSPLERDMTCNNLAHYGNSNYNNTPVHPLAHLPTPPTLPTTSAPSMTPTGAPFRAPVSGFLPPPPTRPPRRHPLRTPVVSDIKFSPSRRNSQDGSIISGFGGGSLMNALAGGLGDAASNNITGNGTGKVEKSRSLLSFLALNKSTSSSTSSPMSNTNDFTFPPARTALSRRNSLPAVHFLGLNLGMVPPPPTTTAAPEVKKQRRSSILGLSRLDRSEKKEEKEAAAAAAAALEALETFQAEVLLIRDPSPPQTPAPAKSPTSNRRFSLPAAVLSSASLTPPSASNSPPSLLSSFPPTATKSTSGSSRPSSRGSSRPSSG